MQRWRRFLKSWGPRPESTAPFYPDQVEPEHPVLLNRTPLLAAGFVAARLLHAIALRGGSPVRPATLERLENLLAHGLSEEALHHCQAEAEAILAWLESPPPLEAPPETQGPATDLDLMVAADLQSRLSVARFALEEGYDLELEYYDEDRRIWPRIKAPLLEIEDPEAADFQTALLLQDRNGAFSVPLKFVRWLMPVAPEPDDPDAPTAPGAEVIPFGRRPSNDSRETD
jgi:hypothetical protein